MQNILRELRQLVRKLGLLASLVGASLALFVFQSWLHASGGWPLLVVGLVCLWSAALAGLVVAQERRRRERERAIDAAVAAIRRVVAVPVRRDDEDRRP
ncbi:MAG TPA: hypothetical protein PKD53_17970 [Chloroflexaceae bacterium]|nr:hypothetical protein [Chloroflexaceae bacterium]